MAIDQYQTLSNYLKQLKALKVKRISVADFGAVVDKLGAANYHKDAQFVSATDEKELETVYTNFIADELKIADRAAGMKMLKGVMTKMKPIKKKYRAVVYYMLTQKVKESQAK